MYERNAIVLERYFYDIFKYNETSNLKENYKNYCALIENYEKYKNATEAQNSATEEFEKSTAEITRLQKLGEKLYNKSAKLEYSRYIVLENIEETTEKLKRCLEKIENDVEKNTASLKKLDNDFVEAQADYKSKKEIRIDCEEDTEKTKNAYKKILEKTENVFSGISDEDVDFAKDFESSDNKDQKKELSNILTENGINEKNPFDTDVISNAVNISFDIYKKEIEIYLTAYERTKKFFDEIEVNDVKLDKHKKLINDSIAKLDFLSAKKDYIVGFLDNERMVSIYDKKIHRKLMLEACRNLNNDLVHLESLYNILLKEIASRATKRLYKENYNKSYLLDIEKVSENVGEEINKLKANSVAVVNLNYWRIEGITRVQEAFEKDVKEIYGRNLDEIFPKENTKTEETAEDSVSKKSEKVKETTKKKVDYKKLKSSKQSLKTAISKKNNNEDSDEETSVKDNVEDSKEVNIIDDILQENDSDIEDTTADNTIFEKISMLDELDNEEIEKPEENADFSKIYKKMKDMQKSSNENENNSEENSSNNGNDENEESIFDYYFKELDAEEKKRKLRDEKKLFKENRKNGFFKKVIGINSKKKKEA